LFIRRTRRRATALDGLPFGFEVGDVGPPGFAIRALLYAPKQAPHGPELLPVGRRLFLEPLPKLRR
jgi:hypothetical protein